MIPDYSPNEQIEEGDCPICGGYMTPRSPARADDGDEMTEWRCCYCNYKEQRVTVAAEAAA